MKKIFRFLLIIFISAIFLNIKLLAETLDATMIITNPGADMSNSINISWHTQITGTFVEYTKSVDPNFNSSTKKVGECSLVPFENKTTTMQCRASLVDLEKNTEYIYRVGLNSFSQTYRFKTAIDGTFSFLHVTDIHAYLPSPGRVGSANLILNKMYEVQNNVAFTIISGDATAYGTVYEQWESLYTLDTIKKIPFALTPGNHDYYNTSAQMTDVKYFNSVVNNPNNGANNLSNSTYFFRYNNALFISVNSEASAYSSTALANQQQWFKTVVENNPAEYIIVYTHRPFYTGDGENASQAQESRNWWQNIFDKYGVDLVLSGHNHVYARTHQIYNNQIVPNTTTEGTVYMTGFQIGDRYKSLTGTPMPQVAFSQIGKDSSGNILNASTIFTVTTTGIQIKFINANGDILDSYTLGSKAKTFTKSAYSNSLKITSDLLDFSKATLSFMDAGIGRINKIEVFGEDQTLLGSVKNPSNITSINLNNIPTTIGEYLTNIKVTLRTGEIINKSLKLINEKYQFGSIRNLIVQKIESDTYLMWESQLIEGRLSKLQIFIDDVLYNEVSPNEFYITMNDVNPYKKHQITLKALNQDNNVVFTQSVEYGIDVTISYNQDKQTIKIGESTTPTYLINPQQDLTLEFKSSNPEVAIVNEQGQITALSAGVAVITMNIANTEDVSDSIEITVITEPSDPNEPNDPNDPNEPNDPKEPVEKKGCFNNNGLINISLLGFGFLLFRKRRIF